MSGHNLLQELLQSTYEIADPGDTKTIGINRQFCIVPIVTAAAETRTLPAPTKPGMICILQGDSITTGCTITITGGVNDTSNTVLVITETGQYAVLISVKKSTVYSWSVLYSNCGTKSVVGGFGTVTSPLLDATADKHFFETHAECSAASGTTRLRREWLYLSGGAGGECWRAATTVMAAAPADTCNAIHATLEFGSTYGNITGLGTAIRAGVLVGKRAITGTVAAIMAELYGETSGTVGGAISLIRGVVDGETTSKANINANAYFLDLAAAAAEGNMVEAGSTLGTAYGGIKCRINGVKMYIPLYSAAPS